MLQRHLKTHQPAVLLSDSAAGTTVDLPPPQPPPPSPPLKKQGETPVCEICIKRFLIQKASKRHPQTVHRQSGGFLCHVCDRRFYRKDHLKRHHVRKHGHKEYETLDSYPCPLFQKSFHYVTDSMALPVTSGHVSNTRGQSCDFRSSF